MRYGQPSLDLVDAHKRIKIMAARACNKLEAPTIFLHFLFFATDGPRC
jgi:hypothetical protein